MSKLHTATNVEIWNAIQAKYPNFAATTGKATRDLFTERGFEMLAQRDSQALDDFFNLSIRAVLQFVKPSEAKNPLSGCGLVEYYGDQMGGILQRIYVDTLKPISPMFMNLEEGKSVDQFRVRKPHAKESWAKINFSFQTMVSLSQYEKRQIFLDDYGMGSFLGAIMKSLENGYTVQEYNNTIEVLNTMINSIEHPLQDTQKLEMTFTDVKNPTNEELTDFILGLKDVAGTMAVTPQTGAYNAAAFASVANPSDHVLLIRPGILNRIQTNLLAGVFNPETLSLPFEVQPILNFGGLEPYKEAGYTTPLYPVYDSFGSVIGFNESEGQSNVTVEEKDVYWKDNNENVIAVIAQKGAVFVNHQGGLEADVVPNYPGKYTNHYLSISNVTVCGDYHYNFITVSAAE